MSGQPRVNPSDASKFRQQYLANLALQAENDDINLQANKTFKKTGQTPVQPTDFRLTSERLADVERLKIDVRSKLKEIADGTQADKIANELSPSDLAYVAQHIEEIIKDLKPKYKYGVVAEIFIPYVKNYIKKEAEIIGVKNGLQQHAGRNLLMGAEQIKTVLVDSQFLGTVKDALNDLNLGTVIKQNLFSTIQILEDAIPSDDALDKMDGITNPIIKSRVQNVLNNALNNVPTKDDVNLLMSKIMTAQRMGDAKTTISYLAELKNILTIEPSVMQEIKQIEADIIDKFTTEQREERENAETEARQYQRYKQAGARAFAQAELQGLGRDAIARQQAEQQAAEQQAPAKGKKAAKKPQGAAAEPEPEAPPPQEKQKKIKEDAIREAYKNYLENKPNDKKSEMEYIKKTHYLVESKLGNKTKFYNSFGKGSLPSLSDADRREAIIRINEALKESVPGMVGSGLRRRRHIAGRGISKPAEDADYTKGIMPDFKYVPFGRYLINHHKLNGDIISVKRPNGVNVSNIPVMRVSNDLGNVIRSIVGNGQPQYHQLEKLSDEEKLYLHKLAKFSNISDRISIPSPNRDDDQKDINEFEIMKGEITSGNDSVELIKKFKIKIMKLVKNDLLPKSQAKDLLMDLVSLGY